MKCHISVLTKGEYFLTFDNYGIGLFKFVGHGDYESWTSTRKSSVLPLYKRQCWISPELLNKNVVKVPSKDILQSDEELIRVEIGLVEHFLHHCPQESDLEVMCLSDDSRIHRNNAGRNYDSVYSGSSSSSSSSSRKSNSSDCASDEFRGDGKQAENLIDSSNLGVKRRNVTVSDVSSDSDCNPDVRNQECMINGVLSKNCTTSNSTSKSKSAKSAANMNFMRRYFVVVQVHTVEVIIVVARVILTPHLIFRLN